MLLKKEWVTTNFLTGVALVSATAWIIQYSRKRNKNKSKQIPCSMGWPILGHIPYISQSNPYPLMDYYIKKYGPIFRVKMGSWDTVVLTDYHAIKEAFNHPDMTQRPDLFSFNLISSGHHGLIFSSGSLWQEQRRFALRQLRDLGMGKSSIESHIQREILAITEGLKRNLGQPVDLNVSLNIAITNIVWAIVTGNRMEYDDLKFVKLVNELNKRIELLSKFGPISFVPWMAKLLPERLLGLDVIKEIINNLLDYLKEVIEEHRISFDPDDPRDYIDYFLIEQMKNPNSTFTDIQLKTTINDLFAAGGETTATTLRWAILLISKHPNVMKSLQEEIDSVVGRDRLPCLEDQNRMPYTTAVIHEIQRFADMVPFGVVHSSEKDLTFQGYYIPQGTIVMGFLGHSHRSETFWAKPYEFYPEHFLKPDGQLRKNIEGLFPFSTGKRICLGERLARAELFLFTAHLFHEFNFKLTDNPEPSLNADPRSGAIRWPSPYKVVITERN